MRLVWVDLKSLQLSAPKHAPYTQAPAHLSRILEFVKSDIKFVPEVARRPRRAVGDWVLLDPMGPGSASLLRLWNFGFDSRAFQIWLRSSWDNFIGFRV